MWNCTREIISRAISFLKQWQHYNLVLNYNWSLFLNFLPGPSLWFYLETGGSLTALYHFTGIAEDTQDLLVPLGRVAEPFHLVIEFEPGESEAQAAFIPSIEMAFCRVPRKVADNCPEEMMTCSNEVCVSQRAMCDFTDDCGDYSDEMNCGQWQTIYI